jgi:predicted nuclease of predicted toxin-antitoxin system
MRVLIDECVDPRVKLLLGNHRVATVHEQGWDTLEDVPLMTLAQQEFDVLVTIDRSLEFQQNLFKLQIAVVVVHVPKNQLNHYRMIVEELLTAIEEAQPGKVTHVPTPATRSCEGSRRPS